MKIVWIGGDHPRHLFYLNKINEEFPISGAIIEKREGGTSSRIPDIPENIDDIDKKIYFTFQEQI